MSTARPRGRKWMEFRKIVFATFGDTCHLCHHGGARQVDHVYPVMTHPELAYVLENCRPSHGTRNRCPDCGRCCNQSRAQGPKRPAPGRVEVATSTVARLTRTGPQNWPEPSPHSRVW